MKNIPVWSKTASKALIDIGMSKKELAKSIKVNYNQLCNVMSGTVINENIKFLICDFLKIEA